ncbi:MAG: iron-containing alcohol dehydrogenase [Bacteroidales bacterium]|nr:iron-containing alcohol dehydrogenase [Bacteroidales bacterium]
MENFQIYNPTKLFFGKDSISKIPKQASKYGNKVLLMYGKSSIKKSGLYDRILNLLQDFEIFEYSGIKSNPLLSDVESAVEVAKVNSVDMIIAVGGGSVIDSAKLVSLGAKVDFSPWDFMIQKAVAKEALPVLAVLTLAATGTEMNAGAVIQNMATGQKIGIGLPLMYPKVSFLDPQLTTTVDAKYTAYGIVDLIAHALEAYFGKGDSPLADRFVFSIISEAMEAGEELMRHLDSYELRARVLYASTMALNGTTNHGKISGDWGVHSIGHELSFLYDMPHGASLSIAYPAWMRLNSVFLKDRIEELGYELFGAETVEETIEGFEYFFKGIGSPVRLSEAGISEKEFPKIKLQFVKNKINGVNIKIDTSRFDELLQYMK